MKLYLLIQNLTYTIIKYFVAVGVLADIYVKNARKEIGLQKCIGGMGAKKPSVLHDGYFGR